MKILGTGSALPKRVVTNDELTRFLDTSDEWIATRTGIRERRVLTDDTLHELAVRAAKNALESAGAAPAFRAIPEVLYFFKPQCIKKAYCAYQIVLNLRYNVSLYTLCMY